jgi:hypothetical protein
MTKYNTNSSGALNKSLSKFVSPIASAGGWLKDSMRNENQTENPTK